VDAEVHPTEPDQEGDEGGHREKVDLATVLAGRPGEQGPKGQIYHRGEGGMPAGKACCEDVATVGLLLR
jgi:hypothetical protein